MRATVFLQNAWSPLYAGRIWPRRSWLRALHASRSGTRLKCLTDAAEGVEFWWDNTTPCVGATPNSIIEPDMEHIRRTLAASCPNVVVMCGRQAAKAVSELLTTPGLIIPHPAYRVVTNDLFQQAGRLLVSGFGGVVELRQDRSGVSKLCIEAVGG